MKTINSTAALRSQRNRPANNYKRLVAERRRTRHDRGLVALRDLHGSPESVLRARRNRRAAR